MTTAATAGDRSGWRGTRVVGALAAVLAACLSGCAAPREVYRGYVGAESPDTSLATLELGDAEYAVIDDGARVEAAKYSAIMLSPGTHRVEFGRSFKLSNLIPFLRESARGKLDLAVAAGHRYRLRADQTTGPGYVTYLWVEDAATGEVIRGTKKP